MGNLILNNQNEKNSFFAWLDSIRNFNSNRVQQAKDVRGPDIPQQQNMSNTGVYNTIKNTVSDAASTIKSGIDWDFIGALEGRRLKGYVPTDKTGNVFGQSGVTIGTGFDLGQRSVNDLLSLGASDDLISKLKPYLGKKKKAAVLAIQQKPLRLSNDEVDFLDKAAKKQTLDSLINSYNKTSKVKFEDLKPEQQTILASVAFQYGDLQKRTPNFWKSVTSGDWNKAHRNLMNFGDKYSTRRQKEANLLSNILEA